MADAKKGIALYSLASGIVLDRAVFVSLNSAEMGGVFEIIRAALRQKRLVIVDRASTFFTSSNMLDLIKAGNNDYTLIAEQLGVSIFDSDIDAIRRVEVIIAAMKPPIPLYSFAYVPDNWSIDKDLHLSLKNVKRRRSNSQGDGITYSISMAQLKRIWGVASKFWATAEPPHTVHSVSAAGYMRTAIIGLHEVDISCQTIRRYELEQVAVHLGWKFPDTKTE